MKKLLFILSIVIIYLIGCENEENSKEKISKASSEIKEDNNQESKEAVINQELDSEIDYVRVKESSAQNISPSQASIEQYEIVYKNGESFSPKSSDILNESTIGTKSTVTLQSDIWNNAYKVFLYDFQQKWKLQGVFTLLLENTSSNNEYKNLALPFNDFATGSMNVEGREIWGLGNSKSIITISQYPRFSFSPPDNINEITLDNSNKAYVDDKGFIYYFDSESLVVISGNVEIKDMIKLANSMPSVNSAYFPKSQ